MKGLLFSDNYSMEEKYNNIKNDLIDLSFEQLISKYGNYIIDNYNQDA